MGRLTISLPDELHRALKETAARRGTTIGELVTESLEYYGVKSSEDAEALVRAAREQSGLDEQEAIEVAVAATRESRAS